MIDIVTDLRPMLGPVRDQGARPTCLAFAASDAHAALRNGWTPLSCEFAYYHAQRRAKRPHQSGATLSSMLETLRTDGQPAEAGWVYLDKVPDDIAAWAPPTTVGQCFGRDGGAAAIDLTSILVALDQQRPVMLLTKLSRSFYMPDYQGVIDPANDEMPDDTIRHAIVAVGHGTTNGQTALLVRNSWGESWGINGHAWLTEKFLKPRLFATAILTGDVDVSSSAAAA